MEAERILPFLKSLVFHRTLSLCYYLMAIDEIKILIYTFLKVSFIFEVDEKLGRKLATFSFFLPQFSCEVLLELIDKHTILEKKCFRKINHQMPYFKISP